MIQRTKPKHISLIMVLYFQNDNTLIDTNTSIQGKCKDHQHEALTIVRFLEVLEHKLQDRCSFILKKKKKQ